MIIVPPEQLIEICKTRILQIIDVNEKNLWEFFLNKEGYTIYTMKNPENGITINRTSITVAKSAENIAQFVSNLEKRKMYDSKVEYASVLQVIDKDTQIQYMRIKPPIMFMSSRDLVVIQKVFRQENGTILVCCNNVFLALERSIVYPQQPIVHKVERAELSLFGWVLTPQANGQTNIVLMQCFDLRGEIPQIVANQFTQYQTELMKSALQFITAG